MDIIDRICDDTEFNGLNFTEKELASSPIRNCFRGKEIFLTGATGFLGQLYLEKLLRCDAKRVYILARAKKNQTPVERLRKTVSGVHFSVLRQHNPNFLQRITIIEGDLGKLSVGIGTNDLQMLRENVEIVIHAAADVRFNERLYDLVMTNLRGTREMLLMAESFAKLQVFAYISTAYSHCPRGYHIFEQFYEPPVDPDQIIAFAEQCIRCPEESDAFEVLTELIIKPWPNTYSYSKSLSEELVRRFGCRLNCCVLRPSIVYSTYQEPVPGWTNNVFGINGFLAAIAKGLSRIVLRDCHVVLDVVCADFVINATLAAIWATCKDTLHQDSSPKLLQSDSQVPKIYCVSSSVDSPFTLMQVQPEMVKIFEDEPIRDALWPLSVNSTTSICVFKYLSFFYHFIPCLAFDLVARLTGKKERLLPIMRRVQIFTISLSYFATRFWRLDNSNMRSVLDHMAPIDRRLFMCDLRDFNYFHWSYTHMKGIKVYLLRDPLEQVASARLRYNAKKYLHIFVCMAFYASQLLLIYMLARGLGLLQ